MWWNNKFNFPLPSNSEMLVFMMPRQDCRKKNAQGAKTFYCLDLFRWKIRLFSLNHCRYIFMVNFLAEINNWDNQITLSTAKDISPRKIWDDSPLPNDRYFGWEGNDFRRKTFSEFDKLLSHVILRDSTNHPIPELT